RPFPVFATPAPTPPSNPGRGRPGMHSSWCKPEASIQVTTGTNLAGGTDMTLHHSISASVLRLLPLVIVGPLSAGCVVSGGDGRYIEREEKRFSMAEKDGKPEVKLSTRDGSIEIRSWDRPDVLVVVEKHAFSKQAAAAMTISSSQDGNRVTVDATVPHEEKLSGWFWGGFGSARLIVSVPAASDIQA